MCSPSWSTGASALPNGDLVPAYPPPVLLKNVLATPDPALPVLAGIVTAPVFGSDGTLITEPGYHPATRLLYEPAHELHAAAGPGATDARSRSRPRDRCCSTTCSASSRSSATPSGRTPWRSCCCPSSGR